MPALNNLAGRVIGRLAVIDRAGTTTNGKALWRCACACGASSVVNGVDLTSGHTTSCGCARAERNRSSSLSHGQHNSPTYRTWVAMKTRCTNPRVRSYRDYGAKGVVICARWSDSFAAFVHDMGERPAGLTIDRINPAGNYQPGNCRWATRAEQAKNKRVHASKLGEEVEL